MAPMAPVRIAPTHPAPRLMPKIPKSQPPTKLPTIPMTMFPRSPRLVPLYNRLPSHPAIAPIIIVAIIPIFLRFRLVNN